MNRTGMSLALCGLLVLGTALVGCKEREPATPAPEEVTEPAPVPEGATEPAPAPPVEGAAAVGQTICPVGGDPIDETVFVMHEGQKVYFCCDLCKAPFEEEPEKYLSKLPQFGGQEKDPA
jgi:xanthine dehydrogenase accessory factor